LVVMVLEMIPMWTYWIPLLEPLQATERKRESTGCQISFANTAIHVKFLLQCFGDDIIVDFVGRCSAVTVVLILWSWHRKYL